MRLYGLKKSKGPVIIAVSEIGYGRTTGSQILSDNLEQSKWINFKNKYTHYLRFPYPWYLKKMKKTALEILDEDLKTLKKKINPSKDISGIILETFQGWGALFYPKEYVKKLSEFCKKNKILFAFDEIRQGLEELEKFGFQHYDVVPDMICRCGKELGEDYLYQH